MKTKFFVIKNFKKKLGIFVIFLVIVGSITFLIVREKNNNELSVLPETISEIEQGNINIQIPNVIENQTSNSVQNQGVQQIAPIKDESIPEKVDKYKVTGKLEIPKIKLTTYILESLTKDSLKKSVAKFYGPNINEIGNFCIVGHNYNSKIMFGKLNDLKVGDSIYLTDLYGNKKEYKIYKKYTVKPSDVECLNQNTNGKREVTLITCTITCLKRIIVKAAEV
ncbi:MAG: sortase [Oscillospiraceae bacterium]|nr:sortase [Oscillospiraceae bacterium]